MVWDVTEDVVRWPQWTPTISSVRPLDDRPFGVGSKALVKQPGQAESEWTVTDFVACERFTWETRRIGLVMAATHELKSDGAGTSNTLRVVVSGILGTLLAPILRPLLRKALAEENAGLKQWCETV